MRGSQSKLFVTFDVTCIIGLPYYQVILAVSRNPDADVLIKHMTCIIGLPYYISNIEVLEGPPWGGRIKHI